MPSSTVTSFHECYGSPLQPPTKNLWRIGNVNWTGVRLRDLLSQCAPLEGARYVVSDGLDRGTFAGVTDDLTRVFALTPPTNGVPRLAARPTWRAVP